MLNSCFRFALGERIHLVEDKLDILKIIVTTMERQLKDYDLLKEKNKIFRVTFDFYTPRPHFIILPKPGIVIPANVEFFDKEQIMRDLLNAAQSMLSSFKIPNATLSIHRGPWKTNPKLHAHLCVDTLTYLKIFSKELENDIPDLETQIKDCKTSEWWGGLCETNVQAYKAIVRGYPYKNYFHEEVTAILKASSGPSHVSSDEVPVPNESSSNAVSSGPSLVSEPGDEVPVPNESSSNAVSSGPSLVSEPGDEVPVPNESSCNAVSSGPSLVSEPADEVPVPNESSSNAVSSGPGLVSESADEVPVPNESSSNAVSSGLHKVYHNKHPMIGFVGKKTKSVEELKKVLSAMEGFAKEKGMTNYKSENKDNGCHLCLYLGSGTNIKILLLTLIKLS